MAWRCLSTLVLLACSKEPHAAMTIDGRMREPAWNARAQRGVFVDDAGHEARPYSEIRMLREGDRLYIALYAADEDIRSTDVFDLRAGALSLRLPAISGVGYAVETDGTINRPDDHDEEWVVELSMPAVSEVLAKRCDRPKDGGMRCGHWRGVVR